MTTTTLLTNVNFNHNHNHNNNNTNKCERNKCITWSSYGAVAALSHLHSLSSSRGTRAGGGGGAAAAASSILIAGRRSCQYLRNNVKKGKFIVASSSSSSSSTGKETVGNQEELAEEKEAGWVRGAVSVATQLLRFFSPHSDPSSSRVDELLDAKSDEAQISEIQEVMALLEDDYKRSYFLTGDFSDILYEEDCLFADPTVRFFGRDLYRRNLKLLVPFYDKPSLALLSIEKENDDGKWRIKAFWELRTYLKFPWMPFISVDGCTLYTLNSKLKILEHVESWNTSALEAIPSNRAVWNKS